MVLIFWNRNVLYWKWILFDTSKTSTWSLLSRQSPFSPNEWRGNSSFSPDEILHSFGLKYISYFLFALVRVDPIIGLYTTPCEIQVKWVIGKIFHFWLTKKLWPTSVWNVTYTTYMFDKWCFGSISTSVKSSRPILTSLTVAWYCKIPELVTWFSDCVDVLEKLSWESTSISRGYLQVNCSCGLLFNEISSNSTVSVSRFRRDWVVFK